MPNGSTSCVIKGRSSARLAWSEKGRRPVPSDYFFGADDLRSDTNLLGMMAFFFASYGGGTTQQEDFKRPGFTDRHQQIARKPFVASLPMRMLGLEKGGALAAIAQVDHAYNFSFEYDIPKGKRQT